MINDLSAATAPNDILFFADGSKPVIELSFEIKSVTSITEVLLSFLALISNTMAIGSIVELRTAFAIAFDESATATLVITRTYNLSSPAFSNETIMLFTNSPAKRGLPVGTFTNRVVKRTSLCNRESGISKKYFSSTLWTKNKPGLVTAWAVITSLYGLTLAGAGTLLV